MIPSKNQERPLVGFIVWLLWIVVATTMLGGAAYLFVGGSTLFVDYNTNPLIMYKEVGNGTIAFSGSILTPSACHSAQVSVNSGDNEVTVAFNFIKEEGHCDGSDSGLLETFFVEFVGDEDTEIHVTVGGYKKEVIIK